MIAIERQAHGRTADRNTPATFEQDADDVAALPGHLQQTGEWNAGILPATPPRGVSTKVYRLAFSGGVAAWNSRHDTEKRSFSAHRWAKPEEAVSASQFPPSQRRNWKIR